MSPPKTLKNLLYLSIHPRGCQRTNLITGAIVSHLKRLQGTALWPATWLGLVSILHFKKNMYIVADPNQVLSQPWLLPRAKSGWYNPNTWKYPNNQENSSSIPYSSCLPCPRPPSLSKILSGSRFFIWPGFILKIDPKPHGTLSWFGPCCGSSVFIWGPFWG